MRDGALSIVVCGSSAAMLLPEYLVRLRRQAGLPIRLLLTHSAERFVQPQAMAWSADELYRSHAPELNPIEFALRSKGIAVLPSTAHTLASAALGLAGTPAQTALLASPGPVLFFPAMNRAMWDRDSTRRHVAALRGEGHVVVDPHQREVFELWRREVALAPTLPTPDDVAKIVLSWWDSL